VYGGEGADQGALWWARRRQQRGASHLDDLRVSLSVPLSPMMGGRTPVVGKWLLIDKAEREGDWEH